MEAKDVKHGMHVTVNSSRAWEVLDRKSSSVWWLHRWDENGNWEYTFNTASAMRLVSDGARQECLSEELELV